MILHAIWKIDECIWIHNLQNATNSRYYDKNLKWNLLLSRHILHYHFSFLLKLLWNKLWTNFFFSSTRHHARRSPSTGCHTHASHSHASTPGSSPLHGSNAVAGLLSPHRTPPTSHLGQTGSPHRLSTVTTAAGNGNTTTPPVVAPVAALPNVGIEINDVQQGELIHLIFFFILFLINFKSPNSNCFIVSKKIFYPRVLYVRIKHKVCLLEKDNGNATMVN